MQNIITLGEINDALKFTAVTAAQLADMGFAPLDNKPICEALPIEQSRRLRNAKLYPAESIGQIRVALAKRLAAPASCLLQIQEPSVWPSQAKAHLWDRADQIQRAMLHGEEIPQAAPAAVAVPANVIEALEMLENGALNVAENAKNRGDGYDEGYANAMAKMARETLDALAATPAADIGNPITGTAVPVVLPEPAIPASNGICCGNFSTGAQYMGQTETVCCGQPRIHGQRLAVVIRADVLRELLATGGQAQQPAIMPKGESAAAQLRAMATNYPPGHSWDKLDAKACIRGALEIEALRALIAQAQADARDAERYRALRDERNQLHEDDISVSDSSFNTYFGDELDKASDALIARTAAIAAAKGNEQ